MENGLQLIKQQCKQKKACKKHQIDSESNCRLNKFFDKVLVLIKVILLILFLFFISVFKKNIYLSNSSVLFGISKNV